MPSGQHLGFFHDSTANAVLYSQLKSCQFRRTRACDFIFHKLKFIFNFTFLFNLFIRVQGLVKPTHVRPESILPHRGSMLLIDEILVLDDRCAVTRSVVTDKWPLFDGRNANAIVLVELVAQTSGIHNGFIREKLEGSATGTRGWIVGIRQARFLVDTLAVGTELFTRAENQMEFEGFRDICGRVEIDGRMVAEIALQLLRAAPAA